MAYIENFVVFNSIIKHGGMPDNLNQIAKEIGFDANYFLSLMNVDENNLIIPGTMYKLTKNDIIKHPNLLKYKISATGVKMSIDTPTTAIGSFISDSPNIIAINRNTLEVTSTLCDVINIFKGVPFTVASNLGGNISDVVVDISPFAYNLEFNINEFNSLCSVINDFFVKDFIDFHSDKVIFKQKDAVISQLIASGINENNIFVRENSLYNINYYSNKVYEDTKDDKFYGKFVHGVMYELDGENIRCEKSYIKKYSIN